MSSSDGPGVRAYSDGMTSRSDSLRTTADVMRVVAVLVALAAVVVAVALAVHTIPSCGPNPYDATATVCSGARHPFLALAAAVGVGGLVQALGLEVLGQVARAIGDLRRQQTPAVALPAARPSHLDADGL